MTEPKGMHRRRRSTQDDIPADLAEWFAGDRTDGTPWSALLYPDYMLLRERWKAWSRGRTRAKPPARFEWIAEQLPEQMHGMPYAEAVQQARGCTAEVTCRPYDARLCPERRSDFPRMWRRWATLG